MAGQIPNAGNPENCEISAKIASAKIAKILGGIKDSKRFSFYQGDSERVGFAGEDSERGQSGTSPASSCEVAACLHEQVCRSRSRRYGPSPPEEAGSEKIRCFSRGALPPASLGLEPKRCPSECMTLAHSTRDHCLRCRLYPPTDKNRPDSEHRNDGGIVSSCPGDSQGESGNRWVVF